MESDNADDAMDLEESLPVTPIIERTMKDTAKEPETAETHSILIDDDDEVQEVSNSKQQISQVIDLVPKTKNTKCINADCTGESSEFIYAPDFCLAYFRVRKSRRNDEEICQQCFNVSVGEMDKLADTMMEGQLLFDTKFPIINETVQIDDSDDEEENDDNEYLSEVNYQYISQNMDDIILQTLNKYNLKEHMQKERESLRRQVRALEIEDQELKEQFNSIRKTLDTYQRDFYTQFRPDIKEERGLIIVDDYSLSSVMQVRPENNSPRKSSRSNVTKSPPFPKPKDFPSSLLMDRPALQIDTIYYIVKENQPHLSWIKARLQQILMPEELYNGVIYKSVHYRLIELKQRKERVVSGRHMAYLLPCRSLVKVGTRVLAQFKDLTSDNTTKPNKSASYLGGVIGEEATEVNKYRYLVFFDIGYAQYVEHNNINIIITPSPNVWEDVREDSRVFIKNYLESRDRPKAVINVGQSVKVSYNDSWWSCVVKDIDCSLVKVHFPQLNRWEWIYRGSARLHPIFLEESAANASRARAIRKPGANDPLVRYTHNFDFVPPQENEPAPGSRSVARKSTTRPNAVAPPKSTSFMPERNFEANPAEPQSKIMYYTPKQNEIVGRQYRPHDCGPMCQEYLAHNVARIKNQNPLSKPLLCGWARRLVKDRGRKAVVYKAPCGKTIRNLCEVHYYLRMTESDMTVDLFDFNHMVRCLAEFHVNCNPDPRDLSRGLEQVVIPVINGFTNETLQFTDYSNVRVPTEGVHLNVDEEFLCGCDCEDDCVDKFRCSCWKLTLEGLKYLGKDIDPISVGYIYRRLQEQVITGIYECNSRCKCKSTCLNRVVQNPMSLKLQVFRTHNRGWGIRCLNDVPQGTFICIYAGTLHTEQHANEDGIAFGDEYFAELDYIETVEKFKEDYEEEVMEPEKQKEPTAKPLPIPIKEEPKCAKKRPSGYMNDEDFAPSDSATPTTTDSGIRSRLRRRKEEEGKFRDEPDEEPTKTVTEQFDTVTISDDEDEKREVLSFNPTAKDDEEKSNKYKSVRELFGPGEKDNVYIMDAKNTGNIGRFLNHSCSPNVFVQNVFVDTHDVRFPWVAFFSSQFIRAGTELTWNYNYDIGSVPGRVLYCHCASLECKGRLL